MPAPSSNPSAHARSATTAADAGDARRIPIVGGNWKMHTLRADAEQLAREVLESATSDVVQVLVFPPACWLAPVSKILTGAPAGHGVALGAQDVHEAREGAFTGSISAPMVVDAGATWTLVGHSERRHGLGEPDELVGRKAVAARDAGLGVVLCVGETLEEREVGATDDVVVRQLDAGLANVELHEDEIGGLVVAYEPVWAIGTGRTAEPGDAQSAHAAIRARLAERYDRDRASRIRIQYGGSVKPANAAELAAAPDVDGFLVGGASLAAADFAAIVRALAARA